MDYSLYIKTESCPDKREMKSSWNKMRVKRNKIKSID